MSDKLVYSFNEGSKDMKSLLGWKGANLAEMTQLGFPVPFGFTIITEACRLYYSDRNSISLYKDEILKHLNELEIITGKTFGSSENPLLVSVRSGAEYEIPGIMDTVLNVGLNDETVEGLSEISGSKSFAYDSYRKLLQMFGSVVLNIPKTMFEGIINDAISSNEVKCVNELTADELKIIVIRFKDLIRNVSGREFPQNPMTQLNETIEAVFRSWNNESAILFRKLNDISEDEGTAVNVQSMVFGNIDSKSCTGIAFSRNPVNGENRPFGEFAINAQGEDGISEFNGKAQLSKMAEIFSEIYEEFEKIVKLLEKHYKDVQDVEFVVESGKLFMLQTRTAKRTAEATVKTAVDMVNEGLIDRKTAVSRISPQQVEQLLHPTFDENELNDVDCIAEGIAASPGAASGEIYFGASKALAAANEGRKVILVVNEASPEDLEGMIAAEGILSIRGGMTSYEAVIARSRGICCISGCRSLRIDEDNHILESGRKRYREGEKISLNGTTGRVYDGSVATKAAELSNDIMTVLKWADEIRTLKVRTNADNANECSQAVMFGAEGIGLCRTEYMFFNENRIPLFRRMILSETEEERREALRSLIGYQKEDFRDIFDIMGERPVTIRLIDPPLNEFIPHTKKELFKLSLKTGVPYDRLSKKAEQLHEFNPMLGHRGCRLLVTYPEIAEMQAEAIILAALEVRREKGFDIVPEIMIPLVGSINELTDVKNTVVNRIDKICAREGEDINYMIGTMIEIPRAAITADEIAEESEFFSFGTNDLTQMTYGFSRDDTGMLITEYQDKQIFTQDPFQKLDENGVGRLVRLAIRLGKKTRPNIKLGMCGEQGGDPDTIDFCCRSGINYVSCSPFRVPIARLAAAQSEIRRKG